MLRRVFKPVFRKSAAAGPTISNEPTNSPLPPRRTTDMLYDSLVHQTPRRRRGKPRQGAPATISTGVAVAGFDIGSELARPSCAVSRQEAGRAGHDLGFKQRRQ